MAEDPWTWGWEALGAVSTAFATLVALALPFVMDCLAKRRAYAERCDSVREVIHAVDAAIGHYADFARAVPKGGSLPHIMPDLSAKADLTQATLHLLTQRPGLTDGVISAGLGAAQLANGVAQVALGRADIPTWRIGAEALSVEVRNRVEVVRAHYQLG